MNIIKENLENQVELIKMTVEPADYSANVESALKNYKKKANIPGFRPGMVPMGVVKKMYLKGVLAEEAYRIASREVYTYLQENKIEYIAEPLFTESGVEPIFEEGNSFEFHFKVAVLNPIEFDLASTTLNKYLITINDEMREGYTSNLLNRFGELVDVEEVTKEEAVSCTLEQEDMKIEDAYVGLISMTDEQRAPYIGKKVGDVMSVNVNELYPTESQRASILGVKPEELASINPEFTMTITRIRKFALPTMDAEFFTKAFPDGSIADKAAFDAYVDAQLRQDLDRECYYKFVMDSRSYITETANVTLPEEFLKEWLFTINEGKFSVEEIDNEFPQFVTMMKWDILKKKYAAEGDVKVEQADLLAEARGMASAQFAQYGMANVEDSMLDNYANQILSNKEEQRKIADSLYDMRVVDYIATKATVVEKEVSIDEFREAIK